MSKWTVVKIDPHTKALTALSDTGQSVSMIIPDDHIGDKGESAAYVRGHTDAHDNIRNSRARIEKTLTNYKLIIGIEAVLSFVLLLLVILKGH